MRRTAVVTFLLALPALTAAAGASDADRLLYYEEKDGRVVITNTPSRTDARLLPGFDAAPVEPRPARLPGTIYDSFIERIAAEQGLSPSLVKAVALVESGLDPHAVSAKGAQGLMQLMPATARRYGVRDAFDPLQNLRAGTMHLRRLLDEFDGNLTLALAAYNAGSGAVRRHGGVPAYRETRDYVRKVQGRLGRAGGLRQTAAAPEPPPPPVRMVRQADGSLKLVN